MKRGTSDIDAVDRLLHRHMTAMNAVRLFSSNFVQCISLLLAQLGHGAMSALSLLSTQERTSLPACIIDPAQACVDPNGDLCATD
jgi:hypothetical protein